MLQKAATIVTAFRSIELGLRFAVLNHCRDVQMVTAALRAATTGVQVTTHNLLGAASKPSLVNRTSFLTLPSTAFFHLFTSTLFFIIMIDVVHDALRLGLWRSLFRGGPTSLRR